MPPRPRIRGREPPPHAGSRYRRRSPPPASPRHYRRGRELPLPPPPPPGRRSPERPRRPEEKLYPGDGGGERRSRADILLEAGRLAAEYLVSRGLLPEHSLPGKEATQAKHNSHAEPAAGSYRRKRDDAYRDGGDNEDPRWRRNGGSGGGGQEEEERLPRRSGWDKRSYSYNDRYSDGGNRGDRRRHQYEESRSLSMSRASSYRDRRDSGVDIEAERRHLRRRSRSRNNHDGSRRDSASRMGSGDLGRHELPESGTLHGHDDGDGGGDVNYDNADGAWGELKGPQSVVVVDANNCADQDPDIEDTGMENVVFDGDGNENASGAKHQDNAAAGSNNMNADGIDISEREQSDLNGVYLLEPAKEPVGTDIFEHEQYDLSAVHLLEAVEEPVGTDVFERKQSDLNAVRLLEPAEEPVDLQDELGEVGTEVDIDLAKGDACLIEPVSESNMMVGQHDLITIDLAEKNSCSEVGNVMGTPQIEAEADDDISRDGRQLPASFRFFDLNIVETHENCEMSEVSCDPHADHLCNAVPDLIGGINLQMKYGTTETQSIDEHFANNHHLESEQMLLNQGTDGHMLDIHKSKSEKLLLNQGMDGHALDNHHLKDEPMLLNQSTDGCTDRRMVPIINLEDDYEEQSHTVKFLEPKSEISHNHMDNVLPEHMCSQDQQTSSFPDHHSNMPASSSIKPKLGNLWSEKGAISGQGIPGDDDVLYVAFDKIPLEVINVWDLPSSELGESL